jgi:hypothetical protein
MRRLLLLGLALLPVYAQAGEPTECELTPYKKIVKVDAMTDAKTCIVLAGRRGSVTVSFLGNKQPLVGVAGRAYPGREDVGVRVDGGKAYAGDSFIRGKTADALVAELRAGKQVATQYTPWPDGNRTDTTGPICNLPAVIDECLTEF